MSDWSTTTRTFVELPSGSWVCAQSVDGVVLDENAGEAYVVLVSGRRLPTGSTDAADVIDRLCNPRKASR